jgi:hypothetical protein
MNPENRTDNRLFLVKWGKKERIWQMIGNEFGQVLKAYSLAHGFKWLLYLELLVCN